MVAIHGTYDTMLVPLLMPIKDVLNFLPPQVRNIEPSPLIPFTHQEIEALGLDTDSYDAANNHPVMLELGHQDHTGPGPRLLRPSFDEAKLEVLGMRHPNLGDHQPFSADKGFTFKQMIMFSNMLMSTSSALIAGLRSSSATMIPSKSPSIYADGQDSKIEYSAQNFIEASFTKDDGGDSSEPNGAVVWAGRPWYGWRVSDTLLQFNFEKPQLGPVPYKADIRVKLASFYDPTVASQAPSDWAEFKGGHAWRVRASYSSQDLKVTEAL